MSAYSMADRSGEMVPFKPSLVFFEGVVCNRVPSPGLWTSNISIASSKPQYSLCDVNEGP